MGRGGFGAKACVFGQNNVMIKTYEKETFNVGRGGGDGGECVGFDGGGSGGE